MNKNLELKPVHAYYPLRIGQYYRMISRGRDHMVLKVGGKPICVPDWVFEK